MKRVRATENFPLFGQFGWNLVGGNFILVFHGFIFHLIEIAAAAAGGDAQGQQNNGNNNESHRRLLPDEIVTGKRYFRTTS